jgi:hypothetical protein
VDRTAAAEVVVPGEQALTARRRQPVGTDNGEFRQRQVQIKTPEDTLSAEWREFFAVGHGTVIYRLEQIF